MPIAPLFQRFVDDELARSAELLDRIAVGTIEQLRQPREGMLSLQERQHYHELIELLRHRHGLLREGFVSTLTQLVRADLEEHHANVKNDALGDLGGSLTLMDESLVEADIEISRAAQLIDSTAEWELRELQSFTSTLNCQQHVTPESNPFRPLFYARALWNAASAVTAAPVQRSIFLRLAAGVASGLLKKAWAAAATRIESMGVTPGMYRTVVLTPRPSISRTPAPEASEASLPTLPASAHAPATLAWAQQQLGAKNKSAEAAKPEGHLSMGLPRLGFQAGPEFEQALLRLEELLRQLPSQSAASAGMRSDLASPRLRDHLSALTSALHNSTDQQIIELMARFFDYVLSDTKIHPACRPLVAKLQASALQVALEDPTMLQDHRHAVWAFLDELGASFSLYRQNGDPRLTALFEFADDLVQSLARNDDQDVWQYKRAQANLDAYLSGQREAELKAAQHNMDELLLAERRDQLQRQISQRLVDQMVPLHIVPGIRRFISGDWAKVLAHAVLRHGEQGETTVGYMKTVDDLLWSLNPPDHPQSRQRLLGLLPNLLNRLRQGMGSIDLPAAEQQHVLDELMVVHTEALRPGHKSSGVIGGLTPMSAATPEQIVQMLRDEPEPPVQLGPSFADSLIELSSMDTVPADLIATHPPDHDPDDDSLVDKLRPGSRHRLFLRGRWTRAQLLWRSPRGSYFLWASESPGRTHSITQAALERLSDEKLLLPLEERCLSQRALQALVKELS